ncbi:hypothetical protein ACWEQC_25385 [Streptomyces shenzhenensis]
MTKVLTGLFRARRNDAARSDLFTRSVRQCAEYLAAHDGASGRRQARLAAAIGALTAAHGSPADDPFDALLGVGRRALEVGDADALQLALDLGESATAIRRRSRAAWLLLGRALDGLGRADEAVAAYETHLELHPDHDASRTTVARIGTLREQRACLDEAAGLFATDDAATLRDAQARPAQRTLDDFAAYTRSRVAEHGAGDPAVRRLVELYGRYRRLADEGRVPDPLLGGGEPIGVGGLRRLVAGRTVCLVSGAAEAAARSLGTGLDAYDLVVRCDSLRARAGGTGERVDLHAVSLRGDAPWEAPAWTEHVGIRVVYGDPQAEWRRSVRRRLVPGAQDHVGDATLRRPLSDPALMGEGGWAGDTTTAFTTLRLLDFLDVSPRLDLIGFGLPGQLRPKEKEWVMAHATNVDESTMRIALR